VFVRSTRDLTSSVTVDCVVFVSMLSSADYTHLNVYPHSDYSIAFNSSMIVSFTAFSQLEAIYLRMGLETAGHSVGW
jgi:hypothetical protein